jgi:hypothetical protein
LGAPADESDKLAHVEDALRARYVALDKFFGLKSSSPDIWERRAKELIAREFDIAIDHPQWWRAPRRLLEKFWDAPLGRVIQRYENITATLVLSGLYHRTCGYYFRTRQVGAARAAWHDGHFQRY